MLHLFIKSKCLKELNVEGTDIFLNYHKIDKNTTTTIRRYVNELVSHRTTGHLITKKYQVAGHYFCTTYIMEFSELHFSWVCNGVIRSYSRL